MEKFSNVSELFHYIFRKLEENNVEYFVTGSYALNIYTVPRMTRDIDIALSINRENANAFLDIFSDGFYFNRETVLNDVLQSRMFNIIHKDLSFKLDFIPKIKNDLSVAEFRSKKYEKVLGSGAWVISPEHLFIAKLIWIQNTGSDFHLRDLKNLLALQGINKEYVSGWIKKLNLKTFDINL